MIKTLFKLVLFVALILFLSQFRIANQPIGALVHEKGLQVWGMVSDEATPRKLISAIGDIRIVGERKSEKAKEKPEAHKPPSQPQEASEDSHEGISDEDRQSLMQLLQ